MSYLTERLARKQGLAAPLPTKKEKKPIAKISEKLKKQQAQERKDRGGDDSELVKWFRQRMKQMGNHCYECGRSVENKVYQYAIHSICHILAKRDTVCPSVKTHPSNWITLCPDHHIIFDKSSWEEIEKWGCWETIVERLIMIYPSLDPVERRFFPESVRKIIEENEPF